ncbi:hypothetical protein KP509_28G007300 [Ceratopteris richardii]|uniref:Methyltransferase type 11 domain-containing protein n=1 Tax=Ceratopteris richardii TaxID=49495 RepID=A0A8T2R9A7_CERRI|nr:hypothetical protein KP509_28G007300 [Ceratopteris richardii]KAH7292997.1 hypothetical protein KP509_28G007300 [Ceratopteris richardii]
MTRGAQAYGEASYWDQRYKQDSGPFDWYQQFSGLSSLLQKYVPKDSHVLMVGCGNAVLSEDMVKDGYQQITNIDISSVVIEAMQKKYKDTSQLKYITMDVRDMSPFADHEFDFVIDKGMLDSLMCGSSAYLSAAKMLEEVRRVLKPGGGYMLITYGDPRSRMPHLKTHDSNSWTVSLHVLPKPGSKRALETCTWEVAKPIPLTDEGSTMGFLFDDPDLHYVYVCQKAQESGKPASKGGKHGKNK